MRSFARSISEFRAPAIALTLVAIALALPGCEPPVEPPEINNTPVRDLGSIQIQVTPEWIRPSWTLQHPNGSTTQGAGETNIGNLAVGEYSLTWQPLNGWDSPNPTTVPIPVLSGQTTSARGTYVDQPEQTPGLGTVHIAPLPNGIAAPWTLEGPNGQSNGLGAASLSGMGEGAYTISWASVAGYEPPSPNTQTLSLVSGQSVIFAKTFVEESVPDPEYGNIRVEIQPAGVSGGWLLQGPNGYSQSGSGNTTINDLEVGGYSIEFYEVTGRTAPVPSSRVADLAANVTLTLTTYYGDPSAPVLNSVSGSFSQGATLTLNGSDFGSHNLDVEWMGDWIESASVGTNPANKTGWDHVYGLNGQSDHVSTNRAWSGSKSVDISIDQTAAGGATSSTLSFTHAPFESVYASWWTYIQPTQHISGGESFTQLKYAYITCDGCFDGRVLQAATNSVMNVLRYSKSNNQVVSFHFENNTWVDCPGVPTPFTDTFAQAYGIGYQIPWSYFRPAINGGLDHDGELQTYAPSIGAWCRVEMYAYRGSGPDVPDGELMFTVIKPGQGRLVGHHTGGVVLQTGRTDCRSEPADWERFVFFHFFDDPSIGGDVEKCTINIDDMYLQFGARARIELGDQPVYSNCKQLEIQVPTAWNAGSVQIRGNRGGFAPGSTGYLFVIREDGSVSNGVQVQL